ncbi:Calx-beta domain-containing protein [Limnospira platensis CENA597]|uniref:Calx-beta domain-containing protein n=1 Tax=Limnospira platensis TaxID=118562 RepID=UPI003DA06FC3
MENTREILAAIMPEPSDYPNPLPPLGFSGDGSVNPLTAAAQIEAALTQVNQQLTEFVASANFQGDLQTAFGASTDVELGATIIEALSQGETPNLKVLSARSMNGADGAFDSVTGTVYLSEGVIHSEKLVDVITEEFGHYIDSQLNEIDSPGDEGELFMRLVNGEALSEADITGLRNQDDWGFIWVGGEQVAVQMSGSPEFAWTDLLGSGKTDRAWALTTGSDGSIYMAGWTEGNLDGQTNSSERDAFITKYQPDGSKDWTRLLGTSHWNEARALTTGSDGSIYVAGLTWNFLDGHPNSGEWDAFVTKYQPNGSKDWTRLLGTSENDEALALTTGSDGSIYVAGRTEGDLGGQTNSGNYDAFITKYRPDDTKVWTRLWGTSEIDEAVALTTGSDGSIYVAGGTAGDLDGQTNSGGRDAFVTKYQPDGSKDWTRLLGTSETDEAHALTTGRDGSIYVAGYTGGNLDGHANSGGYDAFITKYQPDGTKSWTRLLGTPGSDGAFGLTTGRDGSIYVGGWTSGNLDGHTNSGGEWDAFITKYQPDGSKDWTRLLGSGEDDVAYALTTGSDGSIYVGGITSVNLDGQTNSGDEWNALISKLIVDEDEDLPQITIRDTQLKEGDTGRTNARFVVTLDNPSPERVVVNYDTADGTATAGEDYRRTTGRLIFRPGQTRQVINVPVFGDTKVEPDETFRVILSRPQNAELGRRQATGTILNDDFPQISIRDTQIKEGDRDRTNARFVVTLDNPSPERVVVNYDTADGTATAGEDYRRTTGRLIFRPGQTRQVINVPVFGDTKIEPDETFRVILSRPQNAELGRRQATGTILNDDFPQISIRDTTGRLIFRPGQTRQVINVPVFGDTKIEPDETFTVNLSRPENAQLGRRRATGTIIDDDRSSNAVNLGRLTGEPIVINDEIGFTEGGDRNTEDSYRFNLNREGTVRIILDELFENANLQLLGSTEEIIDQSRNPGNQREIITARNLEPGTYYVRVVPHLAARTEYRLSINLV